VLFFVPETAYGEAEEHLPTLVVRRGGDPGKALALLRGLGRLVELIGAEVYGEFESAARERLGPRDPDDWPILAAALAIGCPIWTEDTEFLRMRSGHMDLRTCRNVSAKSWQIGKPLLPRRADRDSNLA
jgi:predicted nucleic acid-binding protein